VNVRVQGVAYHRTVPRPRVHHHVYVYVYCRVP